MSRQLAAMLDRRVADAAFATRRCGSGRIASVGQASRQRVQVPQRSATASGAMSFSSDVSSVPMNMYEPISLVDQHRVLADPAEARLRGERAVGQRAGIDVAPRLPVRRAPRLRSSAGCGRGRRGSRRRGRSGRCDSTERAAGASGRVGRVWNEDHDRRLRPRESRGRIAANGRRLREVVHRGVMASIEPLVEQRAVVVIEIARAEAHALPRHAQCARHSARPRTIS